MPPATRTRPFGSSAADCPRRDVAMLPVTVQRPVLGLYSSALLRKPVVPSPPATSTWPFGSSVALWAVRAIFILPVFAHVPELPARAGKGVIAVKTIANNAANTSVRTAANLCAFLQIMATSCSCLLYTSDAADEEDSV